MKGFCSACYKGKADQTAEENHQQSQRKRDTRPMQRFIRRNSEKKELGRSEFFQLKSIFHNVQYYTGLRVFLLFC